MLARTRRLRLESLELRAMLSATIFEHDNVGYFLRAATPRLERYDIANQAWLAPVDLAGASGTPTAAHVDDDGIYVAYGNVVYRYNLDGTGQTHLLNVASNVHAIHSDGNLLFLNHSTGLYARLISINKTTNTIIHTIEQYVESVYGSSIATGMNRIFGRTQGVSPSDITYVAYTDAGMFTGGGESPYHGDFPGGSTTWVFPGGTKVVDSSGTIYSTDGLIRLNSFGSTITDIDFHGSDIPILLSGNKINAYSASILPTGSATVSGSPEKIFVNATNVVAFTADATSATGFRAEAVPLANLNPPEPGQPVSPVGLAYTPDKMQVANDGTVLVFSKAHQSIFRWEPQSQSYGATIPLVGTPNYMAYSAANNTIYLAYNSGLIRKIELGAAELRELPFATLPMAPIGLSTAGRYVFAADASGAWESHFTFAPDGTQISAVDWNYPSLEYVWSEANQKMYFFRDGTSPNDLLWEEINANGTAYPNLAPGAIGVQKDSPLHDSAGFSHPIRVSPDGSVVVLGSGAIHQGTTLARQTMALANSIKDAAWLNNKLYTIRTIAGVAQLQSWTSTTYGVDKVVQKSGTAHSLIAISSNRLLAVTIDGAGLPVFTILDSNLEEAPPPDVLTLALAGNKVSENQASGAPVGTLSATGGEAGNTVSYALVSGAGDTDNAAFQISGSALLSARAFDFEERSSYSVRVRATSTNGATAEQSFVIQVANINESPRGESKIISLAEDESIGLSAADFGFSDPDDAPANKLLAVRIVSVPAPSSLWLGTSIVMPEQAIPAAQLGQLRYKPPADANGEALASLTFQVQDDGGTANGGQNLDLAAKTITFRVTPVNDAPVAVNDAYSVVAGNEVLIAASSLLGNDADPDRDSLSIALLVGAGPQHGTLTITNSGDLLYKPTPAFVGADSFEYYARDASSFSSEPATVSLTVAANPSPPFVLGVPPAVTDNTGWQEIPGWISQIVAVNGQPAQFRVTNDNPALFAAQPEIDSTGRLTFQPAANVRGTAEVTVALEVTGSGESSPAASATQTFTIAVAKPNPWHNSAPLTGGIHGSLDVNADGTVSAIDAVLVINYLNAGLPAAIGLDAPIGGPGGAGAKPAFLDTGGADDGQGDNQISPIDAVLVINWLNGNPPAAAALPPAGEGEGLALVGAADVARAGEGKSGGLQDAVLELLALDLSGTGAGRRRRR